MRWWGDKGRGEGMETGNGEESSRGWRLRFARFTVRFESLLSLAMFASSHPCTKQRGGTPQASNSRTRSSLVQHTSPKQNWHLRPRFNGIVRVVNVHRSCLVFSTLALMVDCRACIVSFFFRGRFSALFPQNDRLIEHPPPPPAKAGGEGGGDAESLGGDHGRDVRAAAGVQGGPGGGQHHRPLAPARQRAAARCQEGDVWKPPELICSWHREILGYTYRELGWRAPTSSVISFRARIRRGGLPTSRLVREWGRQAAFDAFDHRSSASVRALGCGFCNEGFDFDGRPSCVGTGTKASDCPGLCLAYTRVSVQHSSGTQAMLVVFLARLDCCEPGMGCEEETRHGSA